MSIVKCLLFIALMISLVHGCFDNCLQCDMDELICKKCADGYELDHQANDCVVAGHQWTYNNQNKWPGDCNVGKRQSPININTKESILCPKNKNFYKTSLKDKIKIHPQGENLEVVYLNQSKVEFSDSNKTRIYESAQFHWHHPSQHKIDGKSFDLELHIVHPQLHNSTHYSVVALLFEVNEHLERDIFDEHNFLPDGQQHPFKFPFKVNDKMVFHYQGSLTTPPCHQTVNWFVIANYYEISLKSYNMIKEAINQGHSNARKVQELNQRDIMFLGKLCKHSLYFA